MTEQHCFLTELAELGPTSDSLKGGHTFNFPSLTVAEFYPLGSFHS